MRAANIARLAVVTAALIAGPMSSVNARERLTGEQELAKMLEGRIADKPVDCLPPHPSANSTVINRTAIVYEVGSTLYVNRPAYPESLRADDIMVTKLTGTDELCSLQIVDLRERSTFMNDGSVSLSQFVPYRRPRAGEMVPPASAMTTSAPAR